MQKVKIAVCQVPDIREEMQIALQWIEKFAQEGQAKDVSLICFPECFLQGYLTDKISAATNAIDLDSEIFKNYPGSTRDL